METTLRVKTQRRERDPSVLAAKLNDERLQINYDIARIAAKEEEKTPKPFKNRDADPFSRRLTRATVIVRGEDSVQDKAETEEMVKKTELERQRAVEMSKRSKGQTLGELKKAKASADLTEALRDTELEIDNASSIPPSLLPIRTSYRRTEFKGPSGARLTLQDYLSRYPL